MCLTALPCPWVHGCNRLITCLRCMMSLCWQLISVLWTRTCFTWPRVALDDPFLTIFSTFCGSKKCFKEKWLFQGRAVLSSRSLSFWAPPFSHLVFASGLIYCYCFQGYLTCLLEKWIRCPATLTRMDLNGQKRVTFVGCSVIAINRRMSHLTFHFLRNG